MDAVPAEAAVEEEPVVEDVPAEEPAVHASDLPAEPAVEEAPVAEGSPATEEPAVEAEPVAEEFPAEEPAFTEPDWSAVSHDASQAVPEEPVAVVTEVESEEDIYTDNSPEALVRRAAHNKGLRCRRGYGPHEIPVAFVNGKVAVYVTETGEKEATDDELIADGWTVLRYSFAQVTDGKAQGDEIFSAVKSNIRAAKASTKKAKKPKK